MLQGKGHLPPAFLLPLLFAAASEPQPVFRCCADPFPDARPLETSGVAELDGRLRAESSFLKAIFGVEAKVVLLPEHAKRTACVARLSDGTFAAGLDAKALRERFWSLQQRNAAVAYVLAHQLAHVLQWQRGHRTPERNRELHADFLAGFFLGKRNFGTLGSGAALDAAFAKSLFALPDEATNHPEEHGAPDDRARALQEGFKAARSEKLSANEAFQRASELYPMPRVGWADPAPAVPADPLTAYLSPRLKKVKVACTHRVPCAHEVVCAHPIPCTHKVACRHQRPCVHKTPCTHRLECRHRVPCVHRVPCAHKVPCVHAIPCRHLEHACDYDAAGHPIPCIHTRHRFDYAHNFDYAHDFDFAHDVDAEHEHDLAHEFDTQHAFDPEHAFDMAHAFDTQHAFDLAHESDPAHDFDIRLADEAAH